MPLTPLVPSGIADLLGRGGTVITGNQRAARTLRLAFDRQSRAIGLATWQPPAIFAWETWAASLYRQLLLDGSATRMVLNRSQELQLWRAIIQADRQWASLQSADALAALAADAWQLLCAYRGRQRLNSLAASGDTRSFQRWAQAFSRRCTSDGYLSAVELEEALIAASESGHLALSAREIILVGFDVKTPAQQALANALRDTGVSIDDDVHPPVAERLYLAAAETPEDELTQAALRIRDLLTANPKTTVAVIVPSLAAERREFDRIFRHILAPELEDITAANLASPYEFSLGQPLASTPLVAAAVELLRLTTGPLAIESISRLLLSPYFATGQNELPARAEFDAFSLRQTRFLRPEITLGRLISLVASPSQSAKHAGLLIQLRSLERVATKLFSDAVPKQRSYSDWAEAMRELLNASGWPGTGTLDSIEFQTRQKFEDALDELATLDFEGIRGTFSEALALFERILQRTLFAPESRDAPIQIMSPLEAAGSHFDLVCFLRASDLEWPARPSIRPLLGWRLQRELGMPGSDTALDFAYAQRITQRITASAATVVFSYAKQTSDSHLRPSPLITALRHQPLDALHAPPQAIPAKLEPFADDTPVPLTHLTVSGGANVLQLQAACGFRAFAEYRLHSTPIETPPAGMDALERGTVIHAALEHLWEDLRTQAALRALTAEQRAAQLSRSIEHSLHRAAADIGAGSEFWPAAYLDLQRRRLHRLLGRWLEMELERPAFEVDLREASETVSIGPLSLKIRIDRVDRLLTEDSLHSARQGGTVLIDYKTGVAKPSDWEGERPDEPQLPLYAVLREPGSLAALAFANIRPGKDMALSGYAARKAILPGTNLPKVGTLEAQLEDWRRVVTTLAQDFADGDARVDPKCYPRTCKHCPQRVLCRLDPNLLARDKDEDTEANQSKEGSDSGEDEIADFGEADA